MLERYSKLYKNLLLDQSFLRNKHIKSLGHFSHFGAVSPMPKSLSACSLPAAGKALLQLPTRPAVSSLPVSCHLLRVGKLSIYPAWADHHSIANILREPVSDLH